VGVYLLPDGQPQLPPAYIESHCVVKKRDGSWCFLPKNYHSVPEEWEEYYDAFPGYVITSVAIDPHSRKGRPPASKPANPPQPPIKTEDTQGTKQTNGTKETKVTKEMQETKDTSSSDHPITGSPDDPISSESPEDIMDQRQHENH
jgi:hypothetical protein